jgi:hypothetical protein
LFQESGFLNHCALILMQTNTNESVVFRFTERNKRIDEILTELRRRELRCQLEQFGGPITDQGLIEIIPGLIEGAGRTTRFFMSNQDPCVKLPLSSSVLFYLGAFVGIQFHLWSGSRSLHEGFSRRNCWSKKDMARLKGQIQLAGYMQEMDKRT